MKILYWNVYIGNNPHDVTPELRKLIEETDPDLVGLGEASRMFTAVDNIKGYTKYAIKETYRGEGDTIVLAKDGVDIPKWRWMKLTKWWKGPKAGLAQGPKRYWNGRVNDEHLGKVRVLVGHWPFNTARQETIDAVVRWFKFALPGRPSVHLGDLNTQPDDMDGIVRRFKGKHVGIRIDRAMFKNCEVFARDLGHHGSDHPAVLFTVRKLTRGKR